MFGVNYNYAMLYLLILLSSCVFSFSNFYAKMPGIGNNFLKILAISLIFAMLEYSFRVTGIWFFGKNVEVNYIYSVNLILNFVCLMFFNKYVLKITVPLSTYISLFLIIIIFIINNILTASKK